MSRFLPRTLLLSILAFSVSCRIGQAQITATFEWLSSADGGSTWQRDLVVQDTQQSVLVRARVAWTPVSDVYFAYAAFDVTVRAVGGGHSDTVSELGSQPSFWNYLGWTGFSSTRFGDTLKIDEARDTAPPGQGERWIGPFQTNPTGPPLMHAENPVEFFQFRLNLDGSLGLREVSSVFLNPMSRPNQFIGLYQPPYTQSDIWVPSTLIPGTVTVIPSPGVTGILLGVGTLLVRRRGR
jgi:hypothetical protein